MAKFINYKNVDFKIGSQNFFASQISLTANASVEPIVLSDGSLIDYAPASAIIGSLSCDFYLNGSIPESLNITGVNEDAVVINFADVEISKAYAKSISFTVEPFQPILISAQFDWYGNVKVQDFKELSETDRGNKEVPTYAAHSYKSYIDKESIFDTAGDGVGDIVSISYNSNCDRPSFFNVDSLEPFRVAKLNKRCEVNIGSDNLGNLISIKGKNANATIYLKDFYGAQINSFSVSGVLSSQSYNVSNGQYLLSEATIEQLVTENKTLI